MISNILTHVDKILGYTHDDHASDIVMAIAGAFGSIRL